MFLPPPPKSSAAMRAASTEPMPLVSWKMPEISLSTPTRTTLSEISARAAPHAVQDKTNARPTLNPLIAPLRFYRAGSAGRFIVSNLSSRQAQHETVELLGQFDLAGQPAVAEPLGGRAIEQCILLVAHRRQPTEPGLFDI